MKRKNANRTPVEAARQASRRSTWLVSSVFLACVLHALVAVQWTYPNCNLISDGPAAAIYGGPLPDRSWAYTSLDWFVVPWVYALNIAILTLVIAGLLYPLRGARLPRPLRLVLAALSLAIAVFWNIGPGAHPRWSLSYQAEWLVPPMKMYPVRIVTRTGYFCNQSN